MDWQLAEPGRHTTPVPAFWNTLLAVMQWWQLPACARARRASRHPQGSHSRKLTWREREYIGPQMTYLGPQIEYIGHQIKYIGIVYWIPDKYY